MTPRRATGPRARPAPAASLALLLVGLSPAWGQQTPSTATPSPDDLPPAESSPAFAVVRDRLPLEFRDNAAYAELLRRARQTPPDELDRLARRDLVFAQFLARPERYRGLPIRLQGTARRVLRIPDVPEALSPSGTLYEAWVFTSDSQGFPFALVFETLPAGLALGDQVDALVVFRGYFLKLMAYRATDKPRIAPLLVGQLEVIPQPTNPLTTLPAAGGASRWLWTLVPLLLVGAYAFYRVVMTLQRTLSPPAGGRRFLKPHHNQDISPEDLDQWLASAPNEPETPENPEGTGPPQNPPPSA